MSPNKKRRLFFFLGFFWILVIFTNSLLPGDISSAQSGFVANIIGSFLKVFNLSYTEESLSHITRTLAHGIEFGILGLIWMLYFYHQSFGYLRVWALGLSIALFDEVIQIFVPGRAFEVFDLLIDGSGVILGSLVVLIFPFIGKWLEDN